MARSRLHLSDDPGLRDRYPLINSMLYDGEISFLLVNPSFYNDLMPDGFRMTGAVAIPSDATCFRKTFLDTYEDSRYVKMRLIDFLEVKRVYIFDKHGRYHKNFPWEELAAKTVVFRSVPDMYVLAPHDWEKDSRVIINYNRRLACEKNGYTGARAGEKLDEVLLDEAISRDQRITPADLE